MPEVNLAMWQSNRNCCNVFNYFDEALKDLFYYLIDCEIIEYFDAGRKWSGSEEGGAGYEVRGKRKKEGSKWSWDILPFLWNPGLNELIYDFWLNRKKQIEHHSRTSRITRTQPINCCKISEEKQTVKNSRVPAQSSSLNFNRHFYVCRWSGVSCCQSRSLNSPLSSHVCFGLCLDFWESISNNITRT